MTTSDSMRRAFTEAIEKAGGQSDFARLISTPAKPVSQQLVSYWHKKGKVPAELVLRVERLTGASRYDLRPDVFCDPEDLTLNVA